MFTPGAASVAVKSIPKADDGAPYLNTSGRLLVNIVSVNDGKGLPVYFSTVGDNTLSIFSADSYPIKPNTPAENTICVINPTRPATLPLSLALVTYCASCAK